MKKIQTDQVNAQLSAMIGQPFSGFSRAGSLLNFGFGAMIEKETPKLKSEGGYELEKMLVPRYSLQVECNFRLICGEDIVVAKGDLYEPNTEEASKTDFDITDFDWDQQGKNRLDEIFQAVPCKDAAIVVEKICANRVGDVRINLSGSLVLEILIDISGTQECWRFFEVGGDTHLVMSGKGVDFD